MSREEEPHIDTNMNTVCEPEEEEVNEDSEELREEHARDRRHRNDEDEE